MPIDVLILNHATVDIRVSSFSIGNLVLEDGMKINRKDEVSEYLDGNVKECEITLGGSGNLAPLIARAGLNVALAFNVGKGDSNGLDSYGRFFCDTMSNEGINLNHVHTHPTLPTAVTLIDNTSENSRGGMLYFPYANDDIDFERFREAVEDLNPKIVHYMYVGLSKAGDRNKGKDLTDFLAWCNDRGIVTSVDSHTLTTDKKLTIDAGIKVKEYELLLPVLPVSDIFFTSLDEAKMISNSLEYLPNYSGENDNFYSEFLHYLMENNLGESNRTKLFGVTFNRGVYAIRSSSSGISEPFKVQSKFLEGQVVDLVGAGDSFRAGVLTYVCRNLDSFKNGDINWNDVLQMGNLFASNVIKSPLNERYNSIQSYSEMSKILR